MSRALFLHESDGRIRPEVEELDIAQLPEGDVLVRVLYSSLNYKDALAVTGRGKIIRGKYPFVPGIDLVGRVEESESDLFAKGDLVIGTGWGLGEAHWGGYAQLQRVHSPWLVLLPDGMTPEQAMAIGTAGLTAMLAVLALEAHGAAPGDGEIIVTGASGGVGSMAVALLAGSGFEVVASSGSEDAHDYLFDLGAHRIIDRGELAHGASTPLESARWSGAIDVVGGDTLAAVLSQLRRHASVAACGLVGSADLRTTVFPFILRGVNLLGIDSNTCSNEMREKAWSRLVEALPGDVTARMTTAEISLDDIPKYSERLLEGSIRGRVVVDVSR